MLVKARPGIRVIDPESMLYLPDAGAEVPETSYWVRRLADGDVERIDAKAAAKPQKGKE